MKIEIRAGESVSFGIRLPNAYDISKLEDLTLKIGPSIFWRLGAELLATDDARVFRAELGSARSARLNGRYVAEIGITDADFGRKVERVAEIVFVPSNGFAFGSAQVPTVNAGIDYLFDLTAVSAAEIVSDVQLLSINRGFSAYEIAVQNGFSGTEVEYALQNSLLFTINITEKGDGDAITHAENTNARVLTFFDDNDAGRHRSDFYASNSTSGGFTLKNDFSTNKFSGTLLCVKY